MLMQLLDRWSDTLTLQELCAFMTSLVVGVLIALLVCWMVGINPLELLGI